MTKIGCFFCYIYEYIGDENLLTVVILCAYFFKIYIGEIK